MNTWKRMGSLTLALAVALTGCQGEKGPKGDGGAPGEQGNPGQDGLSTGAIAGAVKVSYGKPVAGVTVSTVPDVGQTAVTDAAGAYTLSSLPLGTYTVVASGGGVVRKEVPGVVVLAGVTAAKDIEVVYTPVKVSFPLVQPAGFSKAVTAPAPVVTGGTAPYAYSWSVAGSPLSASTPPTAITLANATTATPSFTTGTFAAIAAGVKIPTVGANADYFSLPERLGLVAISPQMQKAFIYNLKVRVTDSAGFYQEATVGIPAIMSSQGALGVRDVPTGMTVVANAPALNATNTYAWTLTVPTGSVAVLDDATVRNPSFTPDKPGNYVLQNGASSLTVRVANYLGVARDCGGCHEGTPSDAKFKAIYDAWENSAHGNHLWKLMERDESGALVWKDPAVHAEALINDVAFPWTSWATPGRMTLPEYGLSNGEGAHYGESCLGCHSVGFNKLISANGFDDQTGYSWSAMAAKMYDDPSKVTPAGDLTKPDPAAWNLLPAESKALAGIQCENCHGPIGTHGGKTTAPKAFFDAQTCATCHDSVGHHDRYMLWSQGGHASRALADELKGRSCAQCHSAQGFVLWANNGFAALPATLDWATIASGDVVEPVSCQACHDPHSTKLRIDESAPLATEAGFTLAGAGSGQLCVTCHQGRRGLRNDSVAKAANDYRAPHQGPQADFFFGQNFYFLGDLTDGATISKHAYAIENTCVGCHMEKTMAAGGIYPAPATTNHSFKVGAEMCNECHSGATLEAVAESFEGGLHLVEAAALTKVLAVLPATYRVDAFDVATDATTAGCTLTAPPSALVPGDIHGNVSFTFKFASPATMTCGTTTSTVSSVAFLASSFKNDASGLAVFAGDSNMVKGLWNYVMLEADKSEGAHNPAFAQRVLAATRANIGR